MTLTDEQVAEIKAGKEKLTESAQKLFTKMYEQAGAAAGAQGAQGAGPSGRMLQQETRSRHQKGFQGDDVRRRRLQRSLKNIK